MGVKLDPIGGLNTGWKIVYKNVQSNLKFECQCASLSFPVFTPFIFVLHLMSLWECKYMCIYNAYVIS